jgi:hypothetical protein
MMSGPGGEFCLSKEKRRILRISEKEGDAYVLIYGYITQ